MKTINLLAVIIFSLFSSNFSFAQNTSVRAETIKVWGNCSMCKKTIEKAAKEAGAISAEWGVKTKILKVSYRTTSTSQQKIEMAIANAGYDTENVTADQAAYDKLHACCQYDRKTGKSADVAISKSCCKHNITEAASKKCCNKTEVAAKHCCSNVDCKHDAAACKDSDCCKDKACCKS